MPESINRIITTPYPNPQGVAWDGSYLWCAFKDDNKICMLDANGVALQTFDSPGSTPRGLCFAKGFFYSADSGTDIIYKLDRRMNILDSMHSFTPDPRGLGFDGKQLWVAEYSSLNRVVTYDLDFNFQQIIAMVHTDVNGFAFVGTFMYYSDATTGKIWKERRTGEQEDNYAVTPGAASRGLAYDGTYLYLAAGAVGQIYVLNI